MRMNELKKTYKKFLFATYYTMGAFVTGIWFFIGTVVTGFTINNNSVILFTSVMLVMSFLFWFRTRQLESKFDILLTSTGD